MLTREGEAEGEAEEDSEVEEETSEEENKGIREATIVMNQGSPVSTVGERDIRPLLAQAKRSLEGRDQMRGMEVKGENGKRPR